MMQNSAAQTGDMHTLTPSLDPIACRRWWHGQLGFSGSAGLAPSWLNEEVARRMASRLEWINVQPKDWLHVHPSMGGWQVHRLIEQRYPGAIGHILEPSDLRLQQTRQQLGGRSWRNLLPWRKRIAWCLPGQVPQSVDMLWANLQLHAYPNPLELLRQWRQSLRPDGFLMFSCLGPDALQELRLLYQKMGWPAPCSQWTDMHDWGDMLIEAGFAEPVMDMERITLQYTNASELLAELRTMGRNWHPQRHASLRGRHWPATLIQAIERHWPERSSENKFTLSFEIVYGHAWRPKPKPQLQLNATTRISLEDMKSLLRPN